MKKGTQNHTSHFALHTSQTGITLISLIITIIVMLILVGVTVNVALTGGLFTKASDASKQMQIQAEKEELLLSVVTAIGYDGKVVIADIELPSGWTGSNGTYTSPKGNIYTVDENGKITGGESGEKSEPIQHNLTVTQVAKGAYSDMAVIELNVDLQLTDKQKYEVIEKGLQIEFGNNKSLEENCVEYYNEMMGTNFTEFEQLGITLDEAIEYYYEEQLEEASVMAFYDNATYSIIRPDGTIYEQVGAKNKYDATGEYVYKNNYIEATGDSVDTCYFGPQLGTYKITATLGNHVATGTIVIEEF